MSVDLTFIGQIVVFLVFLGLMKKYLYGPLSDLMEQRSAKIAEGLAAADRSRHIQELAKQKASELLHEAKQQAAEVISRTDKRAAEIVEEAKTAAIEEGERLKVAAQAEIDQEVYRARESLRGQVVEIATAGAGRILKRELDATANDELIKDLVAGI